MITVDISPKAASMLHDMFSQPYLESNIGMLQNAEQALEKVAYEDERWENDRYFRYAYELRMMRQKFEELQEILSHEEPGE